MEAACSSIDDVRASAPTAVQGRFSEPEEHLPSSERISAVDDMPINWCVDDGHRIHALTTVELWVALTRGELHPAALGWRVGMECWTPLKDIAELACAVPDEEPLERETNPRITVPGVGATTPPPQSEIRVRRAVAEDLGWPAEATEGGLEDESGPVTSASQVASAAAAGFGLVGAIAIAVGGLVSASFGGPSVVASPVLDVSGPANVAPAGSPLEAVSEKTASERRLEVGQSRRDRATGR